MILIEQDLTVPVITIDGGAGTGKGTGALYVARKTGFNILDSGLLYRAVALMAKLLGINLADELILEHIASGLPIEILGDKTFLDGKDVTIEIRSDEIGKGASIVSQHLLVRQALLRFQLNMRRAPGLVADGRDMGRIFDTPYRFFITTDAEERARRRQRQFEGMKLKEIPSYEEILEEILRRDYADKTRAASPLVPHKKAIIIDNTHFADKFDTGREIMKHYLALCA